jgi:hypothetical protein
MVRSSRKVRDTRRRSSRSRSRASKGMGLGPGAGMTLGLIGSLVGAAALDQGSDDGASQEPQNQNVMSGGKRGRVSSGSSIDAGDFILRFMEMLNTIKIYHWSTLSYPTHKATDELHEKMSELVDSFIEKYIAITGTPLFNPGRGRQSIPFYECKSLEDYRKKLQDYKRFLVSFNKNVLHQEATELLSIRDDMLGEIDQALYSLRLE